MRRLRTVSRLIRLPAVFAVVLGLVAQGLLPGTQAFPPSADPLWALGGICGPDQGPGQPADHAPGHSHQHCACCQAGPVPFLLPSGVASVGARIVGAVELAGWGRPVHVARVWPAYASRAPPARG
ncbi:MAG: hypothetical protein BGP12_17425 [Rhodospirillales bacterium 70-18]|nr:MAG: hypothetical protein BGP12_17425 [Rhodospirillales bacterium 70-18]